ncbi:tudor and KH domain-containing protein homolog [Anopheles moucheti]|uniref:tudor and KH domain-containing protein homolog n=1 Tax=Anopheles moucheti TaxID=186751 RepID=UPI0022F05D5B|nr:tudor and KH domain-containing protein homolog [Anopheles moucheti]XP_052893541.1 tudor and KH domain-containing protein homolog [Anopheles moucheti]XP_052893542.1 tudor and KH domain-containing protein homolog [Anopheles moucheti]
MKASGPVIPVILGLSLLGASGAYLYMLFKKRRSNSSGDLVDFFTGKQTKQDPVTTELIISNNLIPLVIGRKGYTLKHIQQSTGAVISFSDHHDSNQLCCIQGPSAAVVEKAKEMILKETARPLTITEEVIVPQAACGKILGRCGDELQEICRKSTAKVWLEGRARSESERRVMITGTESQIKVAKELIAQKVKEDSESRKSLLDATLQSREPRIRTPPTSSAPTPTPSDGGKKMLVSSSKNIVGKPSSANFGIGQMEIFVSTIVSPSKFYVQLVGPQSLELDLLVQNMTVYYNQPENRELHQQKRLSLGQIVAAEFNADNKWYRAEISAFVPNEYKRGEMVLDLFFVDYGDNQYTNPTEVYELNPEFLAPRFQAIECFLAKVEPAQQSNPLPSSSVGDEDDWDPMAVSRFEELTHVAQWKKIVSKIVTYRNSKSPLHGRESSPIPGLELYDTAPNGADLINIGQELVAEGLARHSTYDKMDELSRSQLFRMGLTNDTSAGGNSSQSSSIDKVEDASVSSSTSASTVVSSGKHINEVSKNEQQEHVQYRSLANGAH